MQIGQPGREFLNRHGKENSVFHEVDQHADRKAGPGLQLDATLPERDADSDRSQDRDDRQEHRGLQGVSHAVPAHGVRQLVELTQVATLPIQTLGGSDAVDRFTETRGDRTVRATHVPRACQHPALEDPACHHQWRHDRHRPQCQFDVDDHHRGADADEHRRTPEDVEQDPGHAVTHLGAVAGDSGHEPARGSDIEERERQFLQSLEAAVAKVVGDPGRQCSCRLDEQPDREGEEHHHHHEDATHGEQSVRDTLFERLVDHESRERGE